jgi:hypothetical protein
MGRNDELKTRSRLPTRARDFSWLWEPSHFPIQLIPAALFPGIRQPGREADQLLLSSAEVKWSPMRLHGVVLN